MDGTFNSLGFSNTAWAQTQTGSSMTWNSETFAQNQNANAIRWSTMYNFRFDSNRPPQSTVATVGFFKTGSPITVPIQGPSITTAANVTVGGRVTNAAGQGVRGIVTINGPGGFFRSTMSNQFGYYGFIDIPSGVTYTIDLQSKRYASNPQTVAINDNVSNIDFVVAEN
jgi:hypothetical protein